MKPKAEPITLLGLTIFFSLCIAWSIIIGAIVEALKKAIDTPIDPKTKEGIEIIQETTQRGRRPVTEEMLRDYQSGVVDLNDLSAAMDLATGSASQTGKIMVDADKSTEGRFYHRPAWFRRLLPIIPMFIGFMTGPLLFPVILGFAKITVPNTDPGILLALGCFIGLGSGAMSGQFYKAWDSMGGAAGMLEFFVNFVKERFLKKSK